MESQNTDQPILEALRLPDIDRLSLQTEQDLVCLLCDDEFTEANGNNRDTLLQHLLLEHKFVIGDVQLIADLPKYLRYWKRKFTSQPLTTYCTSIVRNDPTLGTASLDISDDAKDQKFSLLSDIILEDRELRHKLQLERLEHVLKVHEMENASEQFNRGCLFCKNVFTKHPQLFDHMAFDHNFSVGQPANLVFVDKFLNILEEKLDNLICLFCEKTFKTREVLKEHMRKKAHKKLNPHNKSYDQFYLVNYLEFGKNWEDLSKEVVDIEEEVTSGFDVDPDENYDWSDWKDNVGKSMCLFCPANYMDNKDLFQHMLQIHGFDYINIRNTQGLDFYQQVKMINYIRRCVHLNTCIGCTSVFPSREAMLEHLAWSDHTQPGTDEWNQPQYFFPTYENDNLLHSLDEGENESIVEHPPVVVPEQGLPDISQSILNDVSVRKALMKKSSA